MSEGEQKYNEDKQDEKLPFEEALDKTGFGLYNIMITFICGLNNIALVCMAFSATVIVPASACDLETTTAQQGAMVAAPYIGIVLGSVFWGYMANVKGRRKILMICLIAAACTNAIGSLSVNWIMLMAIQFITLLFAAGQHSVAMAYVSENIPSYRRNMVVLLTFSVYLIGQGAMSILGIPILPSNYAYYISGLDIYWTSWRTLILVYSVPSLLTVFCLLFVRESPKFVLGRGDEEGALDILKTMHGVNKGRSKEFGVTGILLEQDDNERPKTSVKSQLVPLFKKPLLKPTLIMSALFITFQTGGVFMQWLPTISNLFFQTLQTGEGAGLNLCGMISGGHDAPADENAVPCSMDENALLVVLVVCVMQSGLNAVFSTVFQYTGRRNLAIGGIIVFGSCGIMVNLIPNAIGSAVFFVLFLMNVLIMGMYGAMALAIFPTQVRAVAVSLVVTGGQLTSFAAIQVVNYLLVNSCELGFYLFSAIFTASAGLLFFLPDDRLQTKQDLEKEKEEELVS